MSVENEEISLKELLQRGREWFQYLLSQWKLIVLAGIIGAALGLSYSFIKKPIYTATLTFALEDEKGGNLGGTLGFASTFGFDLGGGGSSVFSGSNLNEFFKSRSMVQRALLSQVNYQGEKISLIEMYLIINDIRKEWNESEKFNKIQFLPNSIPDNFTRVQDSIMTSVYSILVSQSLTVSQKDKKVAITSVEVKSENELFAKFLNEAIVKEVCDFYINTKSKKSRENMAILTRQTDSIRRELNAAINGVALATDQTFNLNPALNVRRTPSSRRQVDVQVNNAILNELVKQTESAKVALRKETPLIQIIDRPILPLSKEYLGKVKGVFTGGVFASFFIIIFLTMKYLLKKLIT